MGHTWHKYKKKYLLSFYTKIHSRTPQKLCSVKYNLSYAESTVNKRHVLSYTMAIPVLSTFFLQSPTKFHCLIPVLAILKNLKTSRRYHAQAQELTLYTFK